MKQSRLSQEVEETLRGLAALGHLTADAQLSGEYDTPAQQPISGRRGICGWPAIRRRRLRTPWI